MSAERPDISLIRKYLNGELDARAMHELERQALDDPFLADALEGYGQAGKDQQPALNDLQSRLQQRIKPEKKRVVLWPRLAVAASVLVFVSVGAWWLLNYRPVANKPGLPAQDSTGVNALATPPQLPAPKPVVPDTLSAKDQLPKVAVTRTPFTTERGNSTLRTDAPVMAESNASPVVESDEKAITADSTLLASVPQRSNTLVRMRGVSTLGHNKTTADGLKDSSMLSRAGYNSLVAEKRTGALPSQLHEALTGRVAGMQVNTTGRKPTDSVKMIMGQVVALNDGKPVPGARITAQGNVSSAAYSDMNGYFKIPAKMNDEIQVNYLGYESQTLKVHDADPVKIALKDDHRSLSDVVVVGYGGAKKIKQPKEAHPFNGWDAFRNYLKKGATGFTGTVKLSFVVNTNGTLSDIKVIKGVDAETDQKAIALIQNGPRWIANVNGKPETVKVSIKTGK
ncbi:carboxypeptidase-like regulatory domain-containing protein [Mucilaginibacter daejeonensis]|uniref:carboxypeptidase-like regulatory domain-containing protein n=1 Tax=Mucilaginibacter daejeonensis TaxID=398049 RepID=UPI001D17A405|nr:carboxypeptidase-like regulatory domain-containing protein [Mucilaginibacter daejeonensis]UEG53527.1 carboxypeptidase-like regulatory domain-containing protein [Mucilaginibacter daejeonensis]